MQAARMYDCTVDTVTLSAAQKALGEQRIRAAGLQSLINVHLVDYRKLPQSFEGAFDSVISIEMIEVRHPTFYSCGADTPDSMSAPGTTNNFSRLSIGH